MRRALFVLVVAGALAALGFGLFRSRPAVLGRPAPAFALPDLDSGRRLGTATLLGKPALVNFWASWCDPCREEAPALARAFERFGGRVGFLGVNMLDGRDEAKAFQRRYGIRYPAARDATGTVAKRFGVTGVPETVFLDADGRIVGRFVGAIEHRRLDAILERLVRLPSGELLEITGRGRTAPVP